MPRNLVKVFSAIRYNLDKVTFAMENVGLLPRLLQHHQLLRVGKIRQRGRKIVRSDFANEWFA